MITSQTTLMADEMTQDSSARTQRDDQTAALARGRPVTRAAETQNPARGNPKPSGGWSKTIINFALDTVLLVIVCTLLFIAAVLRFVFPLPSASAGWTLWGFGYDAWSNLQFALVTILGLAILLHVMLHWSWVCGVMMTKVLKRDRTAAKLDEGQQTLWGVGLLIAVVNVVGLLVGLAYLMVQGPAL
ncbi:MAG: hypothetical protein DWQ37_16770 [Planctomycetota bacterium]|nr:MAG: hypothetical protein DWQ37_16770 [Planctomycetota bacterium]